LNEGAGLMEFLEPALQYLTASRGIDRCALFLLSPSGRELTPVYTKGYAAPPAPGPLALDGTSVIADVARSGRRRLTLDARARPRLNGAVSSLAVAVRSGNDVVGVLNLESGSADAFSPDVVSRCESTASGISAALGGTNVTGVLLRAKVALERTFDAMPDLVAILDHQGRVRRLNRAMSRRLRRPLRELLGEEFQVLFPFCREWLCEATLTPAVDRGWQEVADPVHGVVYELNLLELDMPPPLLGNRVVFMRDVTQERELARQVIAFERRAAAGDLLTVVAHEVRNPLAAIEAAAEVLHQDGGLDPTLKPAVDIVCRQVDRLKVLMQDLLLIGRPLQQYSLAPVSLLRVVESTVRSWSATNATPRVEILAPEGDALLVRAAGGRLEQVILNLLDNAAHHSPPESVIRVALEATERHMRLLVQDEGAGVAREALERVFEPFFTTREEGTGLGLNVVKSIVESHGGQVALWNNAPPPGTTVEVSLPAASKEPA
jgi:signal transduction histidine kinase